MAKPFARKLYKSRQWQDVRSLVLKRSHGLCERCLAAGRITPADLVHHKIPLTPENIDDPSISLNPSRLQALCKDCHEAVHIELDNGALNHSKQRVRFDPYGNVLPLERDI